MPFTKLLLGLLRRRQIFPARASRPRTDDFHKPLFSRIRRGPDTARAHVKRVKSAAAEYGSLLDPEFLSHVQWQHVRRRTNHQLLLLTAHRPLDDVVGTPANIAPGVRTLGGRARDADRPASRLKGFCVAVHVYRTRRRPQAVTSKKRQSILSVNACRDPPKWTRGPVR
jgi:hypothetical protein